MRREAHLVENIWFKGAWGSEFIYALLDREWKLGDIIQQYPETDFRDTKDEAPPNPQLRPSVLVTRNCNPVNSYYCGVKRI